jgi:hypothetical protein
MAQMKIKRDLREEIIESFFCYPADLLTCCKSEDVIEQKESNRNLFIVNDAFTGM